VVVVLIVMIFLFLFPSLSVSSYLTFSTYFFLSSFIFSFFISIYFHLSIYISSFISFVFFQCLLQLYIYTIRFLKFPVFWETTPCHWANSSRCLEVCLFLLHLGQAILLFPSFGFNFTIIFPSLTFVTPVSIQL
jgi:hypothetical protein